MYTNTTGSSADYFTYNTYPQPNICPGCGRCRECGQPAPVSPPIVNPWITWSGTEWSTSNITLTTESNANTAFNTEVDADERDE